jgi:glyoxylase-like metal-dependent hydrolase (beta-lactamase superfamily II)
MFRNVFLTRLILSIIVLLLLAGSGFAEDAATVLDRVAAAMGAKELKSLRYTGEGTGATYGQAFKPGMAWPKITIHSQIRTLDYEAAAMHDEIVLSRAEPRGGGGYPAVGEQHNDQFVSGEYAWNQSAAGPVPGWRYLPDRVHQLWISPHGVVKAALRNNATVQERKVGGQSSVTLSFTEPGRFSATVFINAANLVERVESRLPDPVLGETAVVTRYSDYRDFGGVKFPGRIEQSMEGFPVLDLRVTDVQPNVPTAIAVPEAVRAAVDRVTSEKIAEGVWFVTGGSHNSVVIEMQDHLVLVEAPLNDCRTLTVLEEARQLVPGKPIRYVVNSHSHFDHSGGLRAAVAEGLTIITQAQNRPYFERIFAVPNRLQPDHLAQTGKTPRFKTVDDKLVLQDAKRTLELHRIAGSNHSDTLLMVYLPKEKLLIEADAFTPGAPNAPPPEQPNPNNVNLVENIARLKLAIERILPLHGRVVPLAELYSAVRVTSPGAY